LEPIVEFVHGGESDFIELSLLALTSFLCCQVLGARIKKIKSHFFVLTQSTSLLSSLTPKIEKMAHNQANQVDEILKDLQSTPGFKAYIILNSDGIVIRHTMDSNERAVQHAHHITELYNDSVAQIKDLFDHPEDSRVENVRMRTENYEMIVSSVGSFTLAVFQEETA